MPLVLKIPGAEKFFEDLGEHAGETETSMMQFLHPELLLPLSEAGEGKAKRFKIEALQQGWHGPKENGHQ